MDSPVNENNKDSQKVNIPWIIRFTPTTVEKLAINRNIKTSLQTMVDNREPRNLIFCGPSGVAKTTAVKCLIKEIYRKNKEGVLFINSSDDRGIKIVQDTIVSFCKKKTKLGKAKYKLVVLDEADSMTSNTQLLINNLIEIYKKNTRFIFTCNDYTKIIEAIQSRCDIVRFSFLREDQIVKCLTDITKSLQINASTKALKAIHAVTQGDIRVAINTLQLVYSNCKDTQITEKKVFNMVNKPQPQEMKELLLLCYKQDLMNSINKIDYFRNQGYAPSDIILSMMYTIRNYINNEINEDTKMKFLKNISETCMIVSRGVATELQLTACVCRLNL
uniref:AAA+ ATPase domain-containing protein n=1 Tax=viral metagenome TaxID=1070528 RepID=A0A6C0ACG6_9ZZZZ